MKLQPVKEIFGLEPKGLSKRCKRYMGIMQRGIITKQETINLKSILSNHGLRGNLTHHEVSLLNETFTEVELGKIKLTPEHTEQGIKFLKALIYTPKGGLRKKWSTYIDNLNTFGSSNEFVKKTVDNFSHFELAGFEGVNYNPYRDAFHFMPIWRTVSKDGKFFEYVQCHQSEAENRSRYKRLA